MNKVQRFINNSRILYFEIPHQFKYIPKYIIRKFIRNNPHKYFEIGFIYQYYYKNYERLHEYYQKVMDNGNTLIHLGIYYMHILNKKSKEYFMRAVKLGNAAAMYYLGNYYDDRTKTDLAVDYYLDAIALGNSNAMCNLGQYYQYTEKNYAEMNKYYIQAIELGNIEALYHLGRYYNYNSYNYELMQHYYVCAIKLNHIDSISDILGNYKN